MNSVIRSHSLSKIRPEVLMSLKRFSRTYRCATLSNIHNRHDYYNNGGRCGHKSNGVSGRNNINVLPLWIKYNAASSTYIYNCGLRYIHISPRLLEQPSSKVEATVQTMKNKQKEKVEEIMKEAAAVKDGTKATVATASMQSTQLSPSSSSSVVHKSSSGGKGKGTGEKPPYPSTVSPAAGTEVGTSKPADVTKSLKSRIWDEILHYYHGFRLLFIDINICRKLLWRILNGKTLTRRENKLLVRTTSDLFRLIPFSVFIIVPFMELLLPFFIKFFPGMLPSTFQTAKEREDKLKQAVQVRIEMVKFLQKTLDEMAVQHKDSKSDEAKQFDEFFRKIKNPSEYVSNDEIIKYAKRFEDEMTLDSLSREQLIALCRVLELNTVGTTNFLRFQLRMKLRSLAADDRVIAREGVNTLDLWELQQACKARGMRAYGLTEERMRTQLKEWIDLSLNEKVPPTLLLLSRTMLLADNIQTTDKLKETIRGLPDSVATQTKAAICELEGKIDNKTQIEIIKEEERKIKEEREEEREEELVKAIAKNEAEKQKQTELQRDVAELVFMAKEVDGTVTGTVNKDKGTAAEIDKKEKLKMVAAEEDEKTISSKDIDILNKALKTLSTDKKMVVEKETIKDIKEELEDYKEDVQELKEVGQAVQEPVAESRAAKMLFKKVNRMLGQLDNILNDLENKHKKQQQTAQQNVCYNGNKEEKVHIDELVQTIKKIVQTTEESRLKQIVNVLSKLDTDKDGVITIDEVLKVIEAIGRENVNLNEKQLEELITLLDKEHLLEAEDRIQKALDKSQKEAAELEMKFDKDTGSSSSNTGSSNGRNSVKTNAYGTTSNSNLYKPSYNPTKSTDGPKLNTKTNNVNGTKTLTTVAAKTTISDELIDTAKMVKCTATDMNVTDQKNNLNLTSENINIKSEQILLNTTAATTATTATAATASTVGKDKSNEKILSKTDVHTSAPIPPPPTPPSTTQTIHQNGSKDKMI